jgi:hypothetical protein
MMTMLATVAFDLMLIGSAAWLAGAVVIDALRDRRPVIGRDMAPRARRPVVRNAHAAGARVARPEAGFAPYCAPPSGHRG